MPNDVITVAGDGVTLSLLVWRRFRRPKLGLIERILAMPENYGLADLPAVLPVGTKVTIPIDIETPSTKTRNVVQLWD